MILTKIKVFRELMKHKNKRRIKEETNWRVTQLRQHALVEKCFKKMHQFTEGRRVKRIQDQRLEQYVRYRVIPRLLGKALFALRKHSVDNIVVRRAEMHRG